MTVLVDHNYPHTHALRVLALDGTPLEGVRISVHHASRFYAQDLSGWLSQHNVLPDPQWEYPAILCAHPDAFPVLVRTSWAGEVYTDENGEWITPLHLQEANTWLLRFSKTPDFAHRTLEVTT